MLSKLRPRSIYDVMAAVACFGVLAGGSAYAANTIRSSDIIDNEVTTTDVRDDTLAFGGLYHQDLGSGSVRSSEVSDNSLTGFDIQNLSTSDVANETLTGFDIRNGTLNDDDIGQGTFVNFTVNIGNIAAHDCVAKTVDGINAAGDHLLLTPNATTGLGRIVYTITWDDSTEYAWLQACNTAPFAINDGTTRFNLLVIDAQ